MSRPSLDPTQDSDRGVPPSFDLGLHFRNLRAVVLPALVVGAVIGGLTFFASGSTPTGFVSTVVAQVRSADASAGDGSLGQLTAPYIALATDGGVLTDVKDKVAFPGTVDQLEADITVSQGPAPALLSIATRADSAELAEGIARQVVLSMDGAVQASYSNTSASQVEVIQANVDRVGNELAALDATDPRAVTLQSEYQADRQQLQSLQTASATRLVVLATPINGGSAQASTALPLAGVAGVVATIVAAELLVLLNGRLGSKNSKAWARRAARRAGAQLNYVSQTEHGGLTPGVALMIKQKFASGELVLVLVGDNTVLADAAVDGAFVRPLDDAWWLAPGTHRIKLAVVVVALGADDKAAASSALSGLVESGVEPILIVQSPGASSKAIERSEKSINTTTDSVVPGTDVSTESDRVAEKAPVAAPEADSFSSASGATAAGRPDVDPLVRDWDPTVGIWSSTTASAAGPHRNTSAWGETPLRAKRGWNEPDRTRTSVPDEPPTESFPVVVPVREDRSTVMDRPKPEQRKRADSVDLEKHINDDDSTVDARRSNGAEGEAPTKPDTSNSSSRSVASVVVEPGDADTASVAAAEKSDVARSTTSKTGVGRPTVDKPSARPGKSTDEVGAGETSSVKDGAVDKPEKTAPKMPLRNRR